MLHHLTLCVWYLQNKYVLILLEAAAENEIDLLQILLPCVLVFYQIKHLGLIESESETIDAKLIFYTLSRSVQL